MATVLITGVSGKTGKQVAAALAQVARISMRFGVHRNYPDAASDASSVHFDWEDPSTWPGALDGVEAVYLVKPKSADPAERIKSFLSHAQALRRLVLLSEIEGGNQPTTAPERQVEDLVKSLTLDWTILRPNWFMQNFAQPGFYLEAVRDKGVLTVPAGGQPVSFVDTRDIAEVAVAALLGGHGGKAYTITGPEAFTFAEVARQIGNAAGHAVRHEDPPLSGYLEASRASGASPAAVAYYGRIYDHIQKGETAVISSDVKRVTGRQPRSLANFIAENTAIWRRA